MVRKVLKVDIADALEISSSLVSRYARRGMPVHNIELARAWCDRNLAPSLRKTVRGYSTPPTNAPRGAEHRFSPDELADLLEESAEEFAAWAAFEYGLSIDAAALLVSNVGCSLHSALTRRGVESNLWSVRAPEVRADAGPQAAATRLRIEARIAEIRDEFPDEEVPGDERVDHAH